MREGLDMNPCERVSADTYLCHRHDSPVARVHAQHRMKGGLCGLRREQTSALLKQAWMVRILQANPVRKFWPTRFLQQSALRRAQRSLGTVARNAGRGRHTHLGVFGGSSCLEFELNGESGKKNGWTWKNIGVRHTQASSRRGFLQSKGKEEDASVLKWLQRRTT